jgi:hypothetical protein
MKKVKTLKKTITNMDHTRSKSTKKNFTKNNKIVTNNRVLEKTKVLKKLHKTIKNPQKKDFKKRYTLNCNENGLILKNIKGAIKTNIKYYIKSLKK